MKIFDKRGMMDDLFDFLFTVFVAVLVFWFIHVLLVGSVAASQERSVQLVLDFHGLQKELVSQRDLLRQGEEIDLTTLGYYGIKNPPLEEIVENKGVNR